MNSKHKIIIAGHRGYPERYPENTLLSFKEAINCGCDMIETDVRATKDGELVLMHDASVKRMTGMDKNIHEMTFAEVKELYVGEPSLGLRVPTLRELLELCSSESDLLLDIEIKSDLGKENAKYLVDNTVALCKEYKICDRVMLNSFDFYVLKHYKATYGDLFVTHGYYPYSHMKNVDTDPTPYLDYACFWANGEDAKTICEYLIAYGIKPCTGSRTSADSFMELAGYGCAMFTENDPQLHLDLREKI